MPAVLALLEGSGAPVTAGPGDPATGPGRELCTPTGAALLLTLAQAFGPLPAMAVRAVGVGAGVACGRSGARGRGPSRRIRADPGSPAASADDAGAGGAPRGASWRAKSIGPGSPRARCLQ